MGIQFTCPNCRTQTNVDERFAGQNGRCRSYGATITIPLAPQPLASAPPPAAKRATIPVLIIVLVCGFAFFICGGMLIALLLPAVQAAREAARRNQCNTNLKQIGLALQTYADVYGAFPPGYITDENRRPMHSWRVLILPYLEQQALYDRYDFTEPWDGPSNSQLAAQMPSVYRCPSNPSAPQAVITSYAAISGPGTLFDADSPAPTASVQDGTSYTIAVAEASRAGIHWMEPRDLDISQMSFRINGSANDISSEHPGAVLALYADGHTTTIMTSIQAGLLRALFTKSGGEQINVQ